MYMLIPSLLYWLISIVVISQIVLLFISSVFVWMLDIVNFVFLSAVMLYSYDRFVLADS